MAPDLVDAWLVKRRGGGGGGGGGKVACIGSRDQGVFPVVGKETSGRQSIKLGWGCRSGTETALPSLAWALISTGSKGCSSALVVRAALASSKY